MPNACYSCSNVIVDTLTVLQHNVGHWYNKKHQLISIYRQYNPDSILINDHAITKTQIIKKPYYQYSALD